MATEQPRAVWCCSTCGAIYHKDYPRCPADGAEVVMTDRDPLLGSVVGHYTVERLLGEGGMGRVYLAHHAHLPNKRYAVKVLLGDHAASVAMRTRFTREAERASQLDHPNVVKVVDFGQTPHGLLYIVMDYVDGPALVSLIDQLPMAPGRVIALTRAICRGLVYAHGSGIVHRDLKPENILVSSGAHGPVPRIVDFGLALSVDQSDARLTESGMTMGTPAFAAPEQLAGKAIDHRADLYALGMTMFEMLTGGKAPFEGHLLEVVSARTTRDAPRISERFPDLAIPRELDDIVARLTRLKPADRFASALEVIEALDRVHLGGEARQATESMAIARPPRRWLAAGALAACAGGAVVWYAIAAGGGPAAQVSSAPQVALQPSGAPTPSAAAQDRGPATPPASAAPASSPPAPASSPPTPEGPASATPVAAPVGRASEPEPPVRGPARSRHRAHAGRPAAAPAAPAPAPVSAEARRLVVPPTSSPPPPEPPPAPPAPARELRARIDGVDVSGSLPPGDVQRAVERRWPAIARCAPPGPAIVVARFTIGEARRAQDVRTTGPSPRTNACVAAAVADVRTEAAPDVGDVDVTVRIAFVVKT